eukprot:TRINITY_DN669_c0_g1_i2.p1 TRINITY_DN669_c0_g1~~TRINITY_DN669_c0_g1_i2.p1  ORF type:complete len:307 (+),score=74.52 TRINITY_DN669_c0_g1_i2:1451-2371(+)
MCKLCTEIGSEAKTTTCLLCPNLGGIMKPAFVGLEKKWVHLSCAYWVPEITFGSLQMKEPVEGLEGMNAKRLQLVCSLCGAKGGACIPCGKLSCGTDFHAECGRRANLYAESFVNKSQEVVYRMYCKKHRPLRILRELDINRKKALEEIIAFSKALTNTLPLPKKLLKKKHRIFSKVERVHLLNNVRRVCEEMEGFSLLVEKPEEGGNYRLLPTFFEAKYSDTLRKTFPWEAAKFGKLSAVQCRREFLRTITDEFSFQSKVMHRQKERIGKPRSLLKIDTTCYCMCKKQYHEDRSTMIGNFSIIFK